MKKYQFNLNTELVQSLIELQKEIHQKFEPLKKFSIRVQNEHMKNMKIFTDSLSENFSKAAFINFPKLEIPQIDLSIPQRIDVSEMVKKSFEKDYLDIYEPEPFFQEKRKIGFQQPYEDNQ